VLISEFDFYLPPGLIAQNPLPERDASRMMVVLRKEEKILHARFGEFPAYGREGDVLILNDTKVIPAKVWGKRGEASVEFLFIKEKEPGLWDVLCKPAKRVRSGDRIDFPDRLAAEVVEAEGEGRRVLKFAFPDVLDHLKKIGFAPLPSYIKRRKEDAGARAADLSRYQTVFAAKEGAIAAPTAGLHFTPRVLGEIRRKGARIAEVTLDVGPATFQPIRVERLEDHRMLEETYEISNRAAREINEAKEEKRPVTAVGTTVVRTLESAAEASYRVRPGRGATSLFIRPGYAFKIVDRLLTNFHLPKSTLLMLVAAFASRDLILAAYREAVRERYRFFSYGDCMLIL
jgi:S-adenosylmethionine:tRNA ribosyltransferase-isomerase